MNHHVLRRPAASGSGRGADARALSAANINPRTGLSTDYLNHFSEAIMLLGLAPQASECRAELAAWRPLTYQQYFAASQLAHRHLAVAAYDSADAPARRQFDAICAAMAEIVMGERDASATSAVDAVGRLKSLFARASAAVHGVDAGGGRPSAPPSVIGAATP